MFRLAIALVTLICLPAQAQNMERTKAYHVTDIAKTFPGTPKEQVNAVRDLVRGQQPAATVSGLHSDFPGEGLRMTLVVSHTLPGHDSISAFLMKLRLERLPK
jgi:hypothetical protein